MQLVGRIYRERWMTLLALVVLAFLDFASPRLRSPIDQWWVAMPSVVVAVVVWEQRSLGSRAVRALAAAWVALDVGVLAVGTVFVGGSVLGLAATFGTFFVVAMAGGLGLALIIRRQRSATTSHGDRIATGLVDFGG